MAPDSLSSIIKISGSYKIMFCFGNDIYTLDLLSRKLCASAFSLAAKVQIILL